MPTRVFVFALVLTAGTVYAQDSEPANWIEARQAVARAESLFAVGNYEAALVDFSRAYGLLVGYPRQYVVLHNIGACYERLFRYDEALTYYERYLREGGPDSEGRAGVEAALEALHSLLATVRVEANVRAEVWLDARHRADTPAELRVPAGRHIIEARAALYESQQRELTVQSGGTYRLQLDLQPLSTYRGLDRGFFYASAIATGAVLATAAVLGATTLAAHEHGLTLATDSMHLRTEELERAQADVHRWSVATDVTLGVAAVLGATTVLLYLLTNWDSQPRDATALHSKR